MTAKASSFWKGKRVFVTSPTSFLGAWTVLSLLHLGAEVFGFGEASKLPTNLFDISNLASKISMIYGDMRDERALGDALNFANADVVLHLGQMGFLHDEDRSNVEVISKSVMGTTQLMEALRSTASVRSLVVASSDKVYSRPAAIPSSETSSVVPYEILPTARLCAEFIALGYRHSMFNPGKYNRHKIGIATARLDYMIGGGDFDPKGFFLETVRAAQALYPLGLRNPDSVRSWMHVLDQVNGILLLAEKLYERGPKLAPTYNFGSTNMMSVGEVAVKVYKQWTGTDVPMDWEDRGRSVHGTMDSSLAAADLGWQVSLVPDEVLRLATEWYREQEQGRASQVTSRQLADFFGS